MGYGRVLGTRAGVKINRDESNDKRIVLDVPDRLDYPGRSVLSAQGKGIAKHPRHVISEPAQENSIDPSSNFIPLRLSEKRKRSSEGVTADSIPSSLPKGSSAILESDHSDSDSDSNLEPQMPSDHQDALARKRNLELTRLTKGEPQNIQNWLDLVNHQEDMIMLGRPKDVSLLKSSEKRGLADIKVSIYKEALAHMSGDYLSQEELWIRLLREGEAVWEDTVLHKHWKEAVNSLQTSTRICIGYINFLQTNSTSFRFGVSITCTCWAWLIFRRNMQGGIPQMPQNAPNSLLFCPESRRKISNLIPSSLCLFTFDCISTAIRLP
jgi:NRDE-2, necessary for RNA interference